MLTDNGILILELPDHGEAQNTMIIAFGKRTLIISLKNTLNTALKKNGLEIFASEKTLFTGTAQIHLLKNSSFKQFFRLRKKSIDQKHILKILDI